MRKLLKTALMFLLLVPSIYAQSYIPSSEKPPRIIREFRAAWVAAVYNIDWPSKKDLSEAAQKAEAQAILDQLLALKMNAVILQVRPHADALYASKHEPWSQWLTGTMGKPSNYDPLDYWIQEAHQRGIEVHAWFNPFRALANTQHPVSKNHISRTKPHIIHKYGTMLWADPSHPDTRAQALKVMLDVVRRYDVDGLHLDDYFYPYPSGNLRFDDGKTPSQRREVVDAFVSKLYQEVKKEKPWVRVGISPFGIWRPGIPEGIEAGVDCYEHLAADSRKWLKNGWLDYLAPQLYWRISPKKQSYSALLEWWRDQGSRPVWPGIATSRIQSAEDPGRPASEIIQQIQLSRTIGKNWVGHIHWSAKALMQNQGGILQELSHIYTQPVAMPPMPWLNAVAPPQPVANATLKANQTLIKWTTDKATKIAIQARYGIHWQTVAIPPANKKSISIPIAESIAITAIDRYGNTSTPTVLSKN